MSLSIAVIGECMLELTHATHVAKGSARPMNLSYGGDTLNTAIYLARSNINVSYVTALGDDSMSDWLLEEWAGEGVDCSQVQQLPDTVPGMYMVNVAEGGERSFLYWRKNSPASQLFADKDRATQISKALANYEYLYLSGISLAILDAESLERVFNMLQAYRDNGGKIVFDGNYRPRLWPSKEHAQRAYNRMYQLTDIALPTLEDEAELFGFKSAEQVLQAVCKYGVTEVVVKMGGEGCLAYHQGQTNTVPTELVEAVDTTAAGDSFNAAYLAARLSGQDVKDGCIAGHALASKVIQHPGAIISAALVSS